MKKKMLTAIVLSTSLVFLTACSNKVSIKVKEEENVTNKLMGIGSLIKLDGYLYYDLNTNIVYFWNGSTEGNYATTPSPYIAPNGLPYKYNTETNTLEEIEEDDYEQSGKNES